VAPEGAGLPGLRTTLRTLQDVLSVPNEVAAELASIDDGILEALRDRFGCSIYLRGNRLTLDGQHTAVEGARSVLTELVDLVEAGHAIGPGTVDAVLEALDESADVRDVFEDVVWRHRGKKITPKTVNQKHYVDAIRGCTITFGIGPAGTGKTYLAMALAVAALADGQVGRIILTRPAVEAGERLGFLPGDMLAKVDPYLRPLFDALYDMLDADRLSTYMEKGTIEVAPLAFMRGRTLNDSFIILDEAQNTSPEQMQMFLTRLGFGSKVVVTGDITQIDLPRDQASGLIQVREILEHVEGIAFIEFGNQDVVRHKLVQRIVEAYKRHAEQTGTERRR
jgi:phosphate starvation-inducible protein PhoH and related proteins